DEAHERDHGDDEGDGNEAAAEPVKLLTLVEEVLQEADADDDQGNADVVDAQAGVAQFLKVLGIKDQALREEEREQADGEIDEEDPVPGVIVGAPAAESGADRGRHDNGHAPDGEGHATLLL